ncbi:hypothetical protein LCGC14_2418250 [marine sediment metagenome]|uniref:Uncharacterized protein n=1 Tax=marine sediment metagenome TaxID=412755 RepID=A0A0F9E2J8_9ZZZZ
MNEHPLTKNERGERYGDLYVIARAPSSRYGAQWHCLCRCGKSTIALGVRLRNGNRTSCGCQLGQHPNTLAALAASAPRRRQLFLQRLGLTATDLVTYEEYVAWAVLVPEFDFIEKLKQRNR